MSWSREEALTDPAVREPMMFTSEFRLRFRDIPTEIILRLIARSIPAELSCGEVTICRSRRSQLLRSPMLMRAIAKATRCTW